MKRHRATDQLQDRASLVDSERLKFVCECGDPACRRPVFLTLAEYEAHRPDPIIHRDHERPTLRLVGS
ncbi:MAG TPA: hypothetical protein VK613_09890 [Gaiellaceae bacterium]|nr:hypothetical protein [Gaiellaceae bacterium]